MNIFSVILTDLTQYYINAMEKLGAVVLNCPLAISEHIVSSATCPLVYLGKSTMSLIDVSLINDTACISPLG